jgi:hypothetical protein
VSTFTGQVSQSSDDASETTATVTLTGSTINLGNATGAADNWRGIRFQNVTIPQGATITAATLSPDFVNATNSGTATIFGEAADNAGTYVASSNNISGRSQTTHSASWAMSGVTSSGFQSSPDLTAIVQEIVNRAGWSSGNAMSFLLQITHNNVNTAPVNTYDQSPGNAAQLNVTYSTVAGGLFTPCQMNGLGAGGRFFANPIG